MDYFDNKPHIFRVGFATLVLFFLFVTAVNFYRYTRSTTDENLFTNPRSSLYFAGSVQATETEASVRGSIQVGDLLLSVNNKTTGNLAQLSEVLAAFPGDPMLHVIVLRTAESAELTFDLRKSSLPGSVLRELQPTALVIDVTEDGASDRAGMKRGDQIMRINGQTFKNANEADAVLRQAQIGKTVDYEVLRDNQSLTLHVTLASFGIPLFYLSLVLAGLVYIGVGAFIAIQRPQYAAARLVGFFFTLMGFALSIGPIQRDALADTFSLIRPISVYLAFYFGLAVWLHSLHYFPKERPELLSRRWIRITGYVLALISIVRATVFPNAGIPVPVGFIILFMFVLTVPFIYRKHVPPEHRKLSRTIRWAGVLTGVAAGVLGYLIASSGGIRIYLLGYMGFILLLVPLSYLYTIARYRLLEMNLRVRRNVQYSFVSVAWAILSFVVLLWSLSALMQTDLGLPDVRLTGASIEVIEGPMPLHQRVVWEKSVAVLLAIGLTFFFRWSGRSGQEFIAKKFYRAQYDYRRAASELADVMATKLNMNELARGIVEKLTELMRLKRVGVMFFRDKSTCCQEALGFDGNAWTSFCISIQKDIVQGLGQFSREASVEYLPKELKAEFRRNEIQYTIPIRSKEKLIGALLIGEKLSESAFHSEDLEFLAAVAKQASVAIENAFLYEELAEQERMKHELAIARRIQMESLPQTTPTIEGLEIAGVSVPAMEVGGDYFDYLNGDVSKLTVIVGDVSGKGTSAALYMSKVQGILRSLHGFGLSPHEFFVRTNALLCNDMEKKSFVTAMGGFFDPRQRRLVLARAGHLPLFHYHARARTVDRVIPRGLGLGLNAEGVFASELEERAINYEPGDVFLFVTDGITEAQQTNGEQFGEDRLATTLHESSASCAEDIRDQVMTAVKTFTGEVDQHDDQTVVVVKVK